MYRYTMYRDKIELSAQLNETIRQELLKDDPGKYPNRTVLLAAREIISDQGDLFELSDCDLVLVADKFDSTYGLIKINVTHGYSSNGQGLPGRKVTVVCKEFAGIRLLLKGGTGDAGAQGREGAAGKDGQLIWGKQAGGSGKPGGTGQTGKPGGPGGTLSVTFLKDNTSQGIWSLTTISLPGGDGGDGGQGGPGGAGGNGEIACKPNGTFCVQGGDGHTGAKGPLGRKGPAGIIGTHTNTQVVSEEALWQVVRSLSIPDNEWVNYRVRMGEYFFRAFNVTNPGYLKMAFNEFNTAINLDPANTQAISYRNQVLNNQNIFGLARDADIIPDFDRYEKVFTTYYPIINAVFQAATNMLLTTVTLDQKKQDLQREISNFTGMIQALTDDLNAAAIAKEISVKENTRAKQRVDKITKDIKDKKEEMENASVDIFGAIIGTVGLVASIVTAIPTGGVSLFAGLTSIGTIAKSISDTGIIDIIRQVNNPKEERKELQALLDEAKGLKGHVSNVVNGIKSTINFPKMLEELWSAKIDNAGYKKLVADSIELVYQQLLTDLQKNQADYTLQAADKRLTQGKINKASAEKQLSGLINDRKTLEGASLVLIGMAQHYMNLLTRYAFLGARSLEIYALKDMSDFISYDYGYIHPDKEADYKAGIFPLTQLIAEYSISWNKFSSLIFYRQQYDNYFNSGNWVTDLHRLSFTESTAINDFKSKPELHFSIRLEDLPASRFEAKVVSVYIAFVGARANAGIISAVIEHSGRYEEKKRDNTVVNIALKQRLGVVISKITRLESPGGILGGTNDGVEFWGRGLAADWHLYIEADELQKARVDLSGLTEIQVWLKYQSFLLQVPFSRGLNHIKDGLLLRSPETGQLFVTYGGAKVQLADSTAVAATTLNADDLEDKETESIIAALPTIPLENTLLRSDKSEKLYVVKNGMKLEIPDKQKVATLGLKLSDVKTVPDEALSLLLYGGAVT